jgi:hypothetical protein
MDRQEKITTILEIALRYTVIVSIFDLLQRINTAIFFEGTIDNKIFWFLQRNTLWIIVVAVIILALVLSVKKRIRNIGTNIPDNPIIGLATGIMIVLEGISNLASTLPINIMSVEAVFEAIRRVDVFLDGTKERMVSQIIMVNVFSIVVILCQIVLGIYLFRVSKKKRISSH